MKRGHLIITAVVAALACESCGPSEPLVRACYQGNVREVERILNRRVDPNYVRSAEGHTPLGMAALRDKKEVVRLLLGRGASVDVPGQSDRTPLMLAASRGHDGMVELLLEHDADVGRRDAEGHTALDLAAANGHTSTVALLKRLRLGSTFAVITRLSKTDELMYSGYFRIVDGRARVLVPGAVLIIGEKAGIELLGRKYSYGSIVVVEGTADNPDCRFARPEDRIVLRHQVNVFGRAYGPGPFKIPAGGTMGAAQE